MNIQYYPLIYTATRGLDYDLWLSPLGVNKIAIDICRRCMADDLYGVSHRAKRLYFKTQDFLLWGVSISNNMMLALDPYYYTDAFDRPIRGFYGAYIPLDCNNDMPQSLPLDFDEGFPFTQNLLFEPFVQPYWTVGSRMEIKQTAPIQNLTLNINDNLQEGSSALDAFVKKTSSGCFYGLASRNDETLKRLMQSIISSQKNIGIVTGVENLIQARDLAKHFNIQFIELVKLNEDSEIEIEPKPAISSFVNPDNNKFPDEEKSEEDSVVNMNPEFTSTTPGVFTTSNKKDDDHAPIFRFHDKTEKIRIEHEQLKIEGQDNNQTDNSSYGDFKPYDDNEENIEYLSNRFLRFIYTILDILSFGLASSKRNDNAPKNTEEQNKRPPVFRQKLSKPEKKPFIPARNTISEKPSNPAFDNRPNSPFSDDNANNSNLLKSRFLSNNDNDENDPL